MFSGIDRKYVIQGHVSFTREELDGVPEDVISGYAQRTEGDKVLYDVTFKTPDIWPLVSSICPSKRSFGLKTMKLDRANNAFTRKAAHTAHEARLAVNVEPLSAILRLRKELAEILEYDSWADYATEVKMSKNAANVKEVSKIEVRLSIA